MRVEGWGFTHTVASHAVCPADMAFVPSTEPKFTPCTVTLAAPVAPPLPEAPTVVATGAS